MRAIVLAGGGAKGSYQIGVWRALRELGISYDIVCGTSVGALNGVFFVTGEYALAKYLWSTISNEVILKMEKDNRFSFNNHTIWSYIVHYFLHGSYSNAPLKNLVCNTVDLQKIKRSPIRFGIVTTKVSDLTPIKVEVNQLKEEEICPYLLASASLYPAFPMVQIQHENYMDGGLFDNLPIDLAISMGADQIIAIGLKEEPLPKKYQNVKQLLYLTPSQDLGDTLDFDHRKILSNMQLGYQDALRFFHENYF